MFCGIGEIFDKLFQKNALMYKNYTLIFRFLYIIAFF
jgi:hypothetical protein